MKERRLNSVISELQRKALQYTQWKRQRVIRDYNEQLFVNRSDNLEEMGKFLNTCLLPGLKQEADRQKRPVGVKRDGLVTKSLSLRKIPGPKSLTAEF